MSILTLSFKLDTGEVISLTPQFARTLQAELNELFPPTLPLTLATSNPPAIYRTQAPSVPDVPTDPTQLPPQEPSS